MKEPRTSRIVIAAVIGIAALALPLQAHAVLRLAMTIDSTITVTAIDNSTVNTCTSPITVSCQLPDIDPAAGTLTLGPALAAGGALDIEISVQTQDVAGGPGLLNRIDSTGTQVTNNGTVEHTLSIAIGATDFAGPSVTSSTTGAGQWSTTGGPFGTSNIFMRWFDDPANGQGGTTSSPVQPGNLLDTFSNTAGPSNPSSFSHNGGPFAVNDPALFSMTLQFDSTISPGVRLTGRELTEVKPQAGVPQPSALLLLGSALGLLAWRRWSN